MPKVLDIPEVKIGRSIFPRQFRQLATFNGSEIIPLMYDCNVTPGDTVKIPIKALIRTQTPLYPVMDDLVLDVSAWFVPDRLTWKHFKEFWGENNTTFWEQPTKYEIPQIEAPNGGWNIGSLADYFGIPTGVDGISVSHMPFRAYSLIFNEFWRDENLKEPIFFNDDETTLTGKNKGVNFDYTTDIQLGACPMVAAKRADYFTKALPEPQKGPDVFIPLGDAAPVYAKSGVDNSDLMNDHVMYMTKTATGWQAPGTNMNIGIAANGDLVDYGTPGVNPQHYVAPVNLMTDLTHALSATVNELRTSVALQRYFETISRSGSRYIEILRGVFGVKSSDARLQRPEFLGGKSFPISMSEVQNAAQSSGNQLGNVGGTSKTIINDYLCTKSFEEHGTLMILGVVRVKRHTYQNGIPRMLTRKKQTDFYNRAFDHLGETAVRNDEIYAQGASVTDPVTGEVMDELPFGYQPAFEDMRLGRTYVTGEMRSSAQTSLDAWHYADDYSQLPTLSSEWIDEDKANIDRTLAINSSTAMQFFGDFVFDTEWTRGMSMYGTPGFMDHM